MRNPIVNLALAATASLACTATTSSRNIRTGGVVARIDVTSERGGRSVVETDLVIGGQGSNTYMVLEGGDRLYATAGGDKRPMQATSDGEYEAKFRVDEGEFVVSLEREVDDPAPDNRGVLPPPFDISSDFGSTPLSRKSDKVVIEWTPAGSRADVEIEIDGKCIHDERYDVGGDPGKFEIRKGEIRAWKSKKDDACDVDVTVTRTTTGETDPTLDSDSSFRLHQVRRTRFVSGP
ncbi:MAG: hypothetical protein OXU20_00240 [Myxococcales bacterium]|nr:hypothetical protein [Myxococcales bacterium]MDD9969854.1 hypothetical protein [Myxococcales bacterium]